LSIRNEIKKFNEEFEGNVEDDEQGELISEFRETDSLDNINLEDMETIKVKRSIQSEN
jgi:hypothetical protein